MWRVLLYVSIYVPLGLVQSVVPYVRILVARLVVCVCVSPSALCMLSPCSVLSLLFSPVLCSIRRPVLWLSRIGWPL